MKCEGCGKERSDVQSVDSEGPDLCFICRQEGKRKRVWNERFQTYVPLYLEEDDMLNKEGMSWEEWLAAACFGSRHASFSHIEKSATILTATYKRLKDAWARGEDPTEYAGKVE